MSNFLLIDPHIHSSGISRCSRRSPAAVIAQLIADGTDGIVLTNHCDPHYTEEIGYKAWCRLYVDEFLLTKELGEKYGKKVFFGAEINTSTVKNVHYLIYGITPELFLDSPELYHLPQKELFEWCCANNLTLFQAHPYRNGTVPQDAGYLHGVEINCHPIYRTTEEARVREFAAEHDLFLSCGSDFHGDTYKPKCGIYLPRDIETESELGLFMRTTQPELEIFDIINVDK